MDYKTYFNNYCIINNKLNNTTIINPLIIEKFNNIFKKYDCFNKSYNKFGNIQRINYNNYNNYNKNQLKKYNKKYNNQRNFNNNKKYQKNVTNIKNYNIDTTTENYKKLEEKIINQIKLNKENIKEKTDKNKIISLLNKISSKTYQKFTKNILKELCIENINFDNYLNEDFNNKIIIDSLFEVSYKQSNFFNLYIYIYNSILLNNIISKNYFLEQNFNLNHINNLKNFNLKYLQKIINDFLNNTNNDFSIIQLDNNSNINNTNENYDNFCINNKKIKLLKGKIFIIIQLIKNNILENNYKNILIQNIYKFENFNNIHFLDILHMINYYIKLPIDNINDLKIYTKNNTFKNNYKIKFKIYDIIDNKSYILN